MTPHDRAYIRSLINRLPTVHIKETSKHHVHMREVDGDHNLIADVYCSTDRAHAAEIAALWSEAPNVIRDLLALVDKLEKDNEELRNALAAEWVVDEQR